METVVDLVVGMSVQQPASRIWYTITKVSDYSVWFEDPKRNTTHLNRKSTMLSKINEGGWYLKQMCRCKTEQQDRNCDNFECIRFKEGL